MKKIVNLTGQATTPAQEVAGVESLSQADTLTCRELQLHWVNPPTVEDVARRCKDIAWIAEMSGATHALIEPPGFMHKWLCNDLAILNIRPVYWSHGQIVEV